MAVTLRRVHSSADRPFFIPATTPAEAIARIYSLTGAADSGTRGEKRALVALRDALDLDIDVERTNAYTARRIAEALETEWVPPLHEHRHTLTLDGLNALLEAASEAYHEGSLRQLDRQRPEGLFGPQWATFNPARSKIEAVNRISALTGSGPEWLGPGSKEHKRVLINLAEGLVPHLDTTLSKTALAEALAREFGAPWSDDCKSTGYTISLIGLNTILAGAELRMGRLGVDRALLLGTPEEEGNALAAALLDGWRAPKGEKMVIWDARRSIFWMRRQGIYQAINQMEWQGWYFEAKGREVLNSAFTPNPDPPRVEYGHTTFDYSLRYVWDLKAHTEEQLWPLTGRITPGRAAAPLNDQEAMNECIAEQGLGFLMLGGLGLMDEDGEFVAWHRDFKAAQGKKAAPSNSDNRRVRKAAFAPMHIEAFWFPNTAALDAAKAAGLITGFKQGAQAPKALGQRGAARRTKYNLHVPKARESSLVVARFNWAPMKLPVD